MHRRPVGRAAPQTETGRPKAPRPWICLRPNVMSVGRV
jgi:hypothetical protein